MDNDKLNELENRLKKEREIEKLRKENAKLTSEVSMNKFIIIILILAVFGPVILKHC